MSLNTTAASIYDNWQSPKVDWLQFQPKEPTTKMTGQFYIFNLTNCLIYTQDGKAVMYNSQYGAEEGAKALAAKYPSTKYAVGMVTATVEMPTGPQVVKL